MTTPHIVNLQDTYRTRDGRAVRVLCVDMKHKRYPVAAVIASQDGYEFVTSFGADGKYCGNDNETVTNQDLIRVSPPREWCCAVGNNYTGIFHSMPAIPAGPQVIVAAVYHCIDDNGSCKMECVWRKDESK